MLKFRQFASIIFITILVIFITNEQIVLLLRRDDDSFNYLSKSVEIRTHYDYTPRRERGFPGPSTKIKYILQWSNPKADPFNLMGEGRDTFLAGRCPVNNCFITPNLTTLSYTTDFDAILFHGPEFFLKKVIFPPKRSFHQKYVFVSRESPIYYPIKTRTYDRIFNWTYTYKLNSDIYFGFISIKNKKGEVVGPKKDMHWLDVKDMKDVDSDFKSKLSNKSLAAAWFVSNCYALSRREQVALQMQRELAKHHLVLDIYSEHCSWNKTKFCPKDRTNRAAIECLRKIEKDYYFYLSFENSLSEDYVTEKLLNAVQHYAVPIVYGGADYTRFLPDRSYLNVGQLGVRRTVLEMIYAITHKEAYYEFFKWTNHYSYHHTEEAPETDYMCALCKAINDDRLVKQISVYENMRRWWAPRMSVGLTRPKGE